MKSMERYTMENVAIYWKTYTSASDIDLQYIGTAGYSQSGGGGGGSKFKEENIIIITKTIQSLENNIVQKSNV